MIDLHMINSGEHTANAARQLVRVQHPRVVAHVAQPVWGNTAAARRAAYGLGVHPYVTWIDDDDVVLDMGWVDEALQILQADPGVSAVYPRWTGVGLGAMNTPVQPWGLHTAHRSRLPHAHHLTVMRRPNVAAFFADVGELPMVRDQDWLLVHAQARHGRLVALPAVAYRWVLLSDGARLRPEPAQVDIWARSYHGETVRIATDRMARERVSA